MAKSSIYIINGSQNIHFDIVKSFGLKRSKNLTSIPISNGNKISDHISDNGDTITIEAAVGANPTRIYENNAIDSNQSNEDRTIAAYHVIKQLFESEKAVTLVNKYDSYEDQVMTEVSPIITPDNSIAFHMVFKQARYASEKNVKMFSYKKLREWLSPDKAKDAADPSVSSVDSKKPVPAKMATPQVMIDMGVGVNRVDGLPSYLIK